MSATVGAVPHLCSVHCLQRCREQLTGNCFLLSIKYDPRTAAATTVNSNIQLKPAIILKLH